ncbi:MAG: ABC transporter substrate-binding protein [bacterium]
MKKNLLVIASVVFLLADISKARDLRYGELSFPQTLNPLNTDKMDESAGRLCQLMFNSLLGMADKEPVEELLANMNAKREQKSYTFKLREKIKWHDGTLFTADDVVFTFNILADNSIKSNLKWIMQEVVDSVKKVDSYTVKFTAKGEISRVELLNTIGFVKIIPKHFFDNINKRDWNDRWKWITCGTGPYKLPDEFLQSPDKIQSIADTVKEITLEQNKDYFRGWRKLKPNEERIDNIIMRVILNSATAMENLRSKEIDLLPMIASNLPSEKPSEKDISWTIIKCNRNSFYYFAFDCRRVNTTTRQAFSLATNRKYMLNNNFLNGYKGNTPEEKLTDAMNDCMYGPYPQHLNVGVSKSQFYNIDRVKLWAKEVQLPSNVTLKGHILEGCEKNMCTCLKVDLKEIGVTLKIKSELTTRDVENFDIAFGWWTFSSLSDPVKWLFGTNAPYNICHYSNKEVDKIIKENEISDADTSSGANTRLRNMEKMQKTIGDDCPYIFLFKRPLWIGFNKKLYIKPDEYWFFADIIDWYWKK